MPGWEQRLNNAAASLQWGVESTLEIASALLLSVVFLGSVLAAWQRLGGISRTRWAGVAILNATACLAIFALLAREAGKTQLDAVGELREAADFLRYYANQAENLGDAAPRGNFACISPWNFPLAIFTGQVAAALAAGNGVLAKPAEQTPLIARSIVLAISATARRSASLASGDRSPSKA